MSLKTLTILGLAAAARAFDSISVPPTVEADKETTLTIRNDIGSSNSFDAGFAYFRVFLTISPPGWGYNPVCWLVNQTSIDTTSLKVTIPASVGPDASNYTLSVFEYNTDPNAESSSSGFQYTNDFTLIGGTGVFSAYETDPTGPWSLGPEDHIPCSAYDCVRQCQQKYYPDDLPSSTDYVAIKNAYLCSASCDGTTYPAWDPSWDDVDGDGKSDISSSAVSETAKTTATGASTAAAATASGSSSSSSSNSSSKTTATASSASTTSTSQVPPPNGASVSAVSTGVLAAAGLVAGIAAML